MAKRVFKAIHEFVDYEERILGLIRTMRFLSSDDVFLAALDELIGDCWTSTINGNCPTAEQRKTCSFHRVTADQLLPRILPAIDELANHFIELDRYVHALPLPPENSPGWDHQEPFQHGRVAMDALGQAIKIAKGLKFLGGDDELFEWVWQRVMTMAKWTRESINPPAAERKALDLGDLSLKKLRKRLSAALDGVVDELHEFNEAYVNFPVLPPRPKIHLEPLKFNFPTYESDRQQQEFGQPPSSAPQQPPTSAPPALAPSGSGAAPPPASASSPAPPGGGPAGQSSPIVETERQDV